MTPLPRDLVFEAILDGGVLAALPSLLAHACDARSAWFHWDAGNGMGVVADNGYFPDSYKARYVEEFAVDDPWLMAARRPDRINAFWDYSEVVSEDVFANSRIWNEMARPSGDDTFFCMGAVLTTGEGRGAVALHRGRTRGTFGSEAAHRIQTLAHDLRFMFAARTAMTGPEPHGHALIVAQESRVIYANPVAEAYIARHEGFKVTKGRLVAQGASQRKFADALARCQPPHSQPSVIVVQQADYALPVSLTPLVPSARTVLIRFRPVTAPESPLTRREMQALTFAARGLRIDAIAHEIGLSRATIEFHLVSARRKLKAATLAQAVAKAIRLRAIRI